MCSWKKVPIRRAKRQTNPSVGCRRLTRFWVVGMKYGPKGTHEAVKKLRQFAPELSPPKSGIACDNCGRRIAVSVPDPSTGAKTLLKPFEMAIGAGGEKRRRQSRQSEHFIRDCRDTSCPDLPGVKVGWKENGEPKRTTAGDLGQGKRNRSYLCGPATIQSRRLLGSSAGRNNQFAPALKAGR
jgi:hypothetical protein